MSRRLSRISLALVVLLSSQVWALGLGDIRLESALNQPLRAEIELLLATPDELDNLSIMLASADTFERYGLDRPAYLQDIQFLVVRSGRASGNVVQLRSTAAMAEPFLTFLVEASWSRGRLLREYTVLLDPPTFAPPAAETAPAVQAPSRSTPADSGQIRRPAPAPTPAPAPEQQRPTAARPAPAPEQQRPTAARPAPAPEQQRPTAARPAPAPAPAQPQPVADDTPYDNAAGGDYSVQRDETLWGIASRVRPDSRLTMNQTMLAIFEANPDAFGGNINIMRAGAALRIPSADEIFQINRGEALAEAQRQHAAWSGGTVPSVADTTSRPSLTLEPPDDTYLDESAASDTGSAAEPISREQEVEQRIAELESADIPEQQSLIEIRDNELAALREELARIRGEIYEPPVDDAVEDDMDAAGDAVDPFVDPDADIMTDDGLEDAAADAADDTAADDAETVAPPPSTIIQAPTRSEPSLVDRVMGVLSEWWMIMVGALVIVGGALFWFMRRGGDDDDVESWQPLDSDEMGDPGSETGIMRAPTREESIVVVEEEAIQAPEPMDDTVEARVPDIGEQAARSGDSSGRFDSFEDTFSSDTAINLDQTDPIAEADFHMAYGLYDQAADLVNSALELEPTRQDLLTKLCEIYFVWGDSDAFVAAAGQLNAAVGDGDSEDWDKIVIMGQQIAADNELFTGASAAGATRAVDLSFDDDAGETGALDMELFADSDEAGDIVDIGGADADEMAALPVPDDDGVDFMLGGNGQGEVDIDLDNDMPDLDVTREMPAADAAVETPAIEQQFDGLSGTAELPSIGDAVGEATEESDQAADATAEINLDDLGIDVDDLAETELASLEDIDATGAIPSLSDTGIEEALADRGAETGSNAEFESTGLNLTPDEDLLDATGVTQVLSSDAAVEKTTEAAADLGNEDATMLAPGLGDDTVGGTIDGDQETMLAGLDDDDEVSVFDFAKTEALPKEAFADEQSLEDTGEMPAVASTDLDLDLDDLTAALEVSDALGDTVEQPRDDATVEQQRPLMDADDDEAVLTQAIASEDVSEDLHDARTMTEVGTKLDLARAYVDMGDPSGARSILEEVLDEGDEAQCQQAQQLLDSLPS